MSEAPGTIGVAGAGTMGAGIAQLAALSGARTLLHDPIPEALERGLAEIKSRLAAPSAVDSARSKPSRRPSGWRPRRRSNGSRRASS